MNAERGFLTNLANYMYGPQGTGAGERAYFFGPEYTSRFDYINGWRPDLASPFDPDRAVGYFRFNTGNPDRDALMSIFANEFGLDNYVRAVAKANEGNWFQDGKGMGAVGESLAAATEIVGNLGGGARLFGKALSYIPRAFRASRAAVSAAPAAVNAARAVPVGGRVGPIAVGGSGAASTVVTPLSGLPLRASQAGSAVRALRANMPAAGRVAAAAARPVRPTASALAADAGLLRRAVNRTGRVLGPVARNIGPIGTGYEIATAVPSAFAGVTQLTAPQAQAVAEGRPIYGPEGMTSYWETRPRQFAYRQQQLTPSPMPDVTLTNFSTDVPPDSTLTTDAPPASAPTTPSTPTVSSDTDGTSSGTPAGGAGPAAGAREGIMGIQQQYNNLVRDLRGMYQTTATEEERERIRQMLADIEAQKDAGLEAIASGYAATSSDIRERGQIARTAAGERATEAGARLAGVGSDLEQRMVDQQAASALANRGLGVGAAQVDPTNEWVNLINTIAPIQQNYMTSMGDITGEGIDWLADTTSAQGQAQAADLQRLAFSTSVGAELAERQRIADRINRERELERQALMQISLAGIGAGQSAAQFNADLAFRREQLAADIAAEQQRASGKPNDDIYSLATNGARPETINRWFINEYGRPMTDEERSLASSFYQEYLIREDLQTGVSRTQ